MGKQFLRAVCCLAVSRAAGCGSDDTVETAAGPGPRYIIEVEYGSLITLEGWVWHLLDVESESSAVRNEQRPPSIAGGYSQPMRSSPASKRRAPCVGSAG